MIAAARSGSAQHRGRRPLHVREENRWRRLPKAAPSRRTRRTARARSSATPVNLRGAVFTNAALSGATIRDACLADVSIADAGYEGMRIEGILVTELLRVYRERNGAAG